MNQQNIILNTSRRRQEKEDSPKIFTDSPKTKKDDTTKLFKSLELIQNIYTEIQKKDLKLVQEKLQEVEKNIKEYISEKEELENPEKEPKREKIQMKPLTDFKKALLVLPNEPKTKSDVKLSPRLTTGRESIMGLSSLMNKETFDTTLKEDTEEAEKLNLLMEQQAKKLMTQLLEITISNQKGVIEIPIKDVEESHMKNLYLSFKIIKNDPKKPSFLKRNRIWILDTFNNKIINQNGNNQKDLSFDDVLYVEKNLNSNTNLKLSLISSHEYDLTFENSEERQKFFEVINHFHKTRVVFCPRYAKKDSPLARAVFWDKRGVAKCNMSPQWLEGFSLFCFSWDMNNTIPKDDKTFKESIPKDLDVYVFSVQRSLYQNTTSFFQDILGKDYVLIGFENGWLCKIFVYVKVKHLPKISNYERSHKNWCEEIADWNGSLNFMYRGYSSVSFKINETSFLFIGSHLADNESSGNAHKKINLLELLKSIKNGKQNLDLMQYDFVYLMGDLGYGTSLSETENYKLINEKNIKELIKHDELLIEKTNGKLLYGFEEGVIDFLPTSNLTNQGQYEEKNLSTYSNRIFYRFRPHQMINLEKYSSLPQIFTSGSHPIIGSFYVETRKLYSSIFGEKTNEKWIILRGLHISSRPESSGSIKKPQVIVHGDFLSQNTYFSSKVGTYESSVNPDLSSCMIPAITPLIHQSEYLKKHCLTIEVHDTSRTYSLLGAGVLSLSLSFTDEPFHFKIALSCYGVFSGHLQGTIQTTKITKM